MRGFEERLAAALGDTPAGTVYLAAVSGGADSTAMLAGLAALRERMGFSLHCAHVEHGIRPAAESRGDARAVETLCAGLGVPCTVTAVPRGEIAAYARRRGTGIEAAARLFRYRALKAEARRLGAGKILTAHTRDDFLETVLMRILRGAGPAGLAPMIRQNGRVSRPLLGFSRRDVLGYLGEKNIPFRTDSTNTDIQFFRNRVRQGLIPFLDSNFPSWRVSIQALAETQALAAEFIAEEARRRLPWETSGPGQGFPLRICGDVFLGAPPILREEALFAAAGLLAGYPPGQAGGRGSGTAGEIPAAPRRSAVRRAARGSGPFPGDLGSFRLERRGGFIQAVPVPRVRGERGFSLLIKEAGSYILGGTALGLGKGADLRIRAGLPSGGGDRPRGAVFFSAGLPLVIRSHRGPDRLLKAGHKRRLSDILDAAARSTYACIATAADRSGPAAFICAGPGGELAAVPGGSAAGPSFLFEISSGI